MSGLTNIYKDDVDFAALALQDADFAAVLKANGQLDFSNPESVQQLTKALLKRDFGFKLSLPPDRLCPPVPNRLNYLLWIQELLSTTGENYGDEFDPEREVLGLDVGTGASCIYPLLACSKLGKWRFAGTDVDEKSLQFARENVKLNGMERRIKLLKTERSGPMIPLDGLGFENIDFTICNPPFYISTPQMIQSASQKLRQPFTACTGSESEMVTEGGEIAFVSRMITESLVLRDRVQWYTSMLGIFSSVSILIQKLKANGIENYAVTEFVQGKKTRRWGLAWSFEDLRPRMAVARGVGSVTKALLPFPSEYCINFDNDTSVETISKHINDILSELPLNWMWKASISTGLGFCQKAVWSRAARRQAVQKDKDMNDDDDDDAALGFKIYVEENVEDEAGIRVTIRWLKGRDSVLFESFCGMLKRKLDELST
ncbi:S-adenosyl-L-methionine-dependent methyltransferase [Glarea lozoyensis ATCC 20868]|uniref:S-adenosyl-L-methionine-dependent methyltransferase n=1 Tax=Glarea lozoyensis (strain ATCC 20868 / MF5171) TaxID=1116229 RepID=S3CTZ4_GLAL2|nr:S-adenosyl-L-methionine-dependent methyltransferase [Glarea lozoyensis ATCC 20868]EPE28494.1 S-adenosyl-L-methionine-dependent methyltransferase [Glarea lozoyensis ATCC 20868]